MKTLLLSALVFASFSTFASPVPDYPKVQFGSVFIPVVEVCRDGSKVKTQYPVAVCTEWKGSEASSCSKYVKKILSTPIHYKKEIPSGEGEWKSISMTIPLHYEIPWGYWTEAGFQVVRTQSFSVPDCE